MSDVKGIIYKAINTINGKVYIVQTIGTLEKRKRRHITTYLRSTKLAIHAALKQYRNVLRYAE